MLPSRQCTSKLQTPVRLLLLLRRRRLLPCMPTSPGTKQRSIRLLLLQRLVEMCLLLLPLLGLSQLQQQHKMLLCVLVLLKHLVVKWCSTRVLGHVQENKQQQQQQLLLRLRQQQQRRQQQQQHLLAVQLPQLLVVMVWELG
jgi:arginine exporter protein ArgO